jgi:IS30 family transposase
MLIAFSPARDATMKTYQQLTYELRCQIYALNKTGMSQNKIARQLNVSRLAACKVIKMTTSLIALIELKIIEKWILQQMFGWLREEQSIAISHETIYQHVRSDKKSGGH